jgi:tetratricopeptide (TPR) repeat protein
LLAFAASAGARARLRGALPWLAWGLAWFLAANTALADVYPDWRPYRSSFGALGLGVACTALLGAAHPALLGGLLAARLLAFASSPGPPRVITVKPSEAGFSLDFPKLARWQRLVGETRHLLLAASPRIPTGSRVGRHYMPRLATVAFLDDKSLQVWYRDTTLRWVTLEDAPKVPQGRLAAMVECQPRPPRQLVLLDLEAVRLLDVASAEANRGSLDRAMAVLERADSLQRDRGARVFLGMIAGKRALWYAYARRHDEALREALRGLQLWPESNDLRYVLAAERYRAGNLKDAASQLDTLLAYYPQDSSARRLRRTVRAALARGGAWP